MSPIALRGLVRRWRRHIASVVLTLVLAGALAVHHAAPAFSDAHQAPGIAAVAELCLGVFTVVGVAAVAAAALGVAGRWHPARVRAQASEWWTMRLSEPRARAGPAAVALLCVSRR